MATKIKFDTTKTVPAQTKKYVNAFMLNCRNGHLDYAELNLEAINGILDGYEKESVK